VNITKRFMSTGTSDTAAYRYEPFIEGETVGFRVIDPSGNTTVVSLTPPSTWEEQQKQAEAAQEGQGEALDAQWARHAIRRRHLKEKTVPKTKAIEVAPSQKDLFVRELAVYLVANQATMSIKLQMGSPEAVTWAKLRGATPLFGYPTVDEAEVQLRDFLR